LLIKFLWRWRSCIEDNLHKRQANLHVSVVEVEPRLNNRRNVTAERASKSGDKPSAYPLLHQPVLASSLHTQSRLLLMAAVFGQLQQPIVRAPEVGGRVWACSL